MDNEKNIDDDFEKNQIAIWNNSSVIDLKWTAVRMSVEFKAAKLFFKSVSNEVVDDLIAKAKSDIYDILYNLQDDFFNNKKTIQECELIAKETIKKYSGGYIFIELSKFSTFSLYKGKTNE